MSTHRSGTRFAGLLVVASFVFAACSSHCSTRRRGASTPASAPASAPVGAASAALARGRRHGRADRRGQGRGRPHDHRPARTTGATTARSSTASRPSTASRSTSSTRTAARATRSRPSRPTRTTRARRRRTSSTSGCLRPAGITEASSSRTRSRPGTRSRTRPRTPTATGTATTTASCVRDQHRGRPERPPKDWADLLKPEYKGQVALAGDPRTSNQAISGGLGRGLANGGSLDNAQPGPRLLQAAQRRRQLRAGHRQARRPSPRARRRSASAGPTTASPTRTRSPATRTIEVVGPDDRPLRRHLRPGHQQVRAASQRRQAVDGVPVLRRGPAHLAEGLLQPDPLRGHGRARASSRPTSRPSCRTSPVRVFPTLDQITRPRPTLITEGWADRRLASRSSRRRLRATAHSDRRSVMPRCRRPPRARHGAPWAPSLTGPGSASCRSSLFALLFLVCPVSYLVVGSFQDTTGSRRSRTTPTSTADRRQRLRDSIEISLVTADRSAASSASCWRTRSSSAACRRVPARRADDVLRRRLELRRRAAGPGLHLHARPARAR